MEDQRLDNRGLENLGNREECRQSPFAGLRLPRVAAPHLIIDVVIMVAALYGALFLRGGPEILANRYAHELLFFIPVFLLVRLITMMGLRCYSVMWRYISTVDALRLAQAIALSTLIVVAITFFWESLARLPRSVYFIEALLSTVGLMGARLTRRILYDAGTFRSGVRPGVGWGGVRRHGWHAAGVGVGADGLAGASAEFSRTIIYGAGENGRLLAQRFRFDRELQTQLVGFVDDDPKKQGLVINGVKVLGKNADLASLIERYHVTQVIIAITPLTGKFLRDIVVITRPFNIRPRITSQLTGTGRSSRQLEIVRDLNLADLLNHPTREIDLGSVESLIRGKTVLVTGAGGSIGSELSRQLARYEPRKLLLLDHSEFNLYQIDKELRLATHDTERVVPLLVDIKDQDAVLQLMKRYEPEIVFHAAAYKHVHLVETNPLAAILNNVGGTLNLLKGAWGGTGGGAGSVPGAGGAGAWAGVTHFVMISTDKAVNPAGIMGATKRVCELLVTAQARSLGRHYCSTRFGNVLGSSGSLVPLLRQQIENGGPVTITHKDMTRFFMLIPEAVSLVLKAATISDPGDINVLKMGDPIRIVDIAKSMIALLGKTEEEIALVFTGLRPGEKMFEELYIRGDELATEHPDILTLPDGDSAYTGSQSVFSAAGEGLSGGAGGAGGTGGAPGAGGAGSGRSVLDVRVAKMLELAQAGDMEAVTLLNQLVKSNYVRPAVPADTGHVSFNN